VRAAGAILVRVRIWPRTSPPPAVELVVATRADPAHLRTPAVQAVLRPEESRLCAGRRRPRLDDL
jgi:hypothetical protein